MLCEGMSSTFDNSNNTRNHILSSANNVENGGVPFYNAESEIVTL